MIHVHADPVRNTKNAVVKINKSLIKNRLQTDADGFLSDRKKYLVHKVCQSLISEEIQEPKKAEEDLFDRYIYI